jgi:uncharacterized protein
MSFQFFEIDTLEQELKKLPHLHRVAFAAAICERMLPNYNAFSRIRNWGDPSVPRKALNEIWHILEGEAVERSKICRLREDCAHPNICPDLDDFDGDGSCHIFEALEAIVAIHATLEACLDPGLKPIVQVVESVRFNTIEALIFAARHPVLTSKKVDRELEREAIANHPLAIRELAKENEDLQRLKNAERLDRDFLEWLRTSFDNGGKSVIDVA